MNTRVCTVIKNLTNDHLSEMSDDALMHFIAQDRQDAFAVLVERHQSRVLSYASKFLGNASDGRDVAQEVFIAIWKERHRYVPQGKFQVYLYKMKFNRCQIFARHRRRKEKREEGWGTFFGFLKSQETVDIPFERLLKQERRRLVLEALSHLSLKMRSVVILKIDEELSHEEIVKRMGIPSGTVRSHLSRGIQYLCRFVEGAESTHAPKMKVRRDHESMSDEKRKD